MKFVESLNIALKELLENYKEVILYGQDLLDPYGGAFKVTKGLSQKYPDRVLPTPLSEAAMIGIAGGMSIGGLKPVVEIMFGDFMMLGADQLLNHLVKYEWMYNHKVSTPITIRTTMGGRRGYGPTHSQSLESILASIPGLKIFSPTYFHDPGDLLKKVVIEEKGIKLFCEYKLNYPKKIVGNSGVKEGLSLKRNKKFPETVYLSNADFEELDVLIISHGGNAIMIEELLIDLLIEHELPVQANFPSLIKPIMPIELFYGIEKCKIIIVFEESCKNFGWGSEILAYLVESGLGENKKIARVGAKEVPIPSSTVLEKKVLPTKNDVLAVIKSMGMI